MCPCPTAPQAQEAEMFLDKAPTMTGLGLRRAQGLLMASVPAFPTVSSLWDGKSGVVVDAGLEPSSRTPVGTGDAGWMTLWEFHRLGWADLEMTWLIFLHICFLHLNLPDLLSVSFTISQISPIGLVCVIVFWSKWYIFFNKQFLHKNGRKCKPDVKSLW